MLVVIFNRYLQYEKCRCARSNITEMNDVIIVLWVLFCRQSIPPQPPPDKMNNALEC